MKRNLLLSVFLFSGFFSFAQQLKTKNFVRTDETFANYISQARSFGPNGVVRCASTEYLKSKQKEHLQQLFKDIVYRDIIVRYGIRQAKTLIDIALFLIANVGKEYSLNGIKNTFRVGSANSVADYIQWLEDSYVLFSLPRFSWSLKSVSVNPKKIYCIDSGFAQANSLSFTEDKERLLENIVYLALRRKHKDLYYFKDNGECDFIVKQGQDINQIIQVCTEIHSDNKNREINGLIAALKFFNKNSDILCGIKVYIKLISANNCLL